MSFVRAKRALARQPRGAVGIDWSNPSTRGAILLALPGVDPTLRNLAATTASLARTAAGSVEVSGSMLGVGGAIGDPILGPNKASLNARFSASGQASVLVILRSAGADATGNRGPLVLGAGTGANNEHYPFTDGKIYIGPFSAGGWTAVGVTPSISLTEPHALIATHKSGEQAIYLNGNSVATAARAETPAINPSSGAEDKFASNGAVYLVAFWDRILSAAEVVSLSANPWQLFAPRRIWVPVAAGGGPTTHATSGALAGDGATVAGTAARVAGFVTHATSGALAGAGAALTGAAARLRAFATSGALTGGDAITSGTAARTRAHPTSGALSGDGAITSGTAARAAPGTHPAVGALSGGGAAVAGAAARIALHVTSGALAGAGAALSGAAARVAAPVTHSTTGALAGLGAILLGFAARPAAPIFDQLLAIPRVGLRIRTGEVFQLILGADNKPVAYVGPRGTRVPITVVADDNRALAIGPQGDLLQLI